jgi:hypothetical protein
MIALWHWLEAVSGARDEAGAWYGLWSGLGGALPDLALLAAVLGFAWHRNCHVHRCWRLGRHHVDGTPFVVCRKHHPAMPAQVSAEDIAEAHKAAQP